jgi:hypothetical protein
MRRGLDRPEVARHRPAVVCDQNPVLLGGKFQQSGILCPSEAGLREVNHVDGGLTRTQAANDVGVEVFIREKANRHDRLEAILRRAASSLA